MDRFLEEVVTKHKRGLDEVLYYLSWIVMIFCAKNVLSFAFLLLLTVFLILISRISVRIVLRSIRPIIFIVLFTVVFNIFLTGGTGEPLAAFWIFEIYREGIVRAILMALRVIILITGTGVLLTYTTSPISLTDGLEALLKPLKIVRFPVHELALIMSIALRFIPTLMEETNRIISAQKARGADFDSGNLIKKAKALLPVLIPLIISAFRRADELGDAMDARCYNGSKNRTKYKKLKLSVNDLIAALFTAAILAGIILCNVYLGSIL